MKKLMALVVMLLVFGVTQSAFAAGAILSDKDMDNISAGDWVIIQDSSGNQQVVDVYFNNNDIQLLNESQTELKAVNNANTVDSAVAVQTNIARVSNSNTPTNNVGINGSNNADILNYNPSESESKTESESFTKTDTEHNLKTSSTDLESSCAASASSAASESESCSLNVNYNDNEASASTDQSVDKGEIDQGSGTSSKVATLVIVKTESEAAAEEATESESASKSFKQICAEESTAECQVQATKTDTCEKRSNKSENNHLTLLNTSQKTLQAVSNLNSVGSGAAVQTNIASNVGVSGTITHINSAKVVNGL